MDQPVKRFVFHMPARVLFGAGQLGDLHLQEMPGRRALLVTSAGRSVKTYGYLDRVKAELEQAGAAWELFDGVRPNPTRENIIDGTARAKESGCDFVVGLGGGSVMDCAKCIALMMTNPGDIWDYSGSETGGHLTPPHKAAPIVCITTSAGTGSEVDMTAVISNDAVHEKSAIFSPAMFPTLSVVDAELMLTVPPELTAYQGMDAFFHASESVLSRLEHPMGEMFALKAIELIARYLPRAYRDGSDLEARENMALANSLAAYYMFCISGHRIEHAAGSWHPELVHGAGLIMTAHAFYEKIAASGAAEERMVRMARAMGRQDAEHGSDFIDALDALIAEVGCGDLRLSSAGITEEELPLFVDRIHRVQGGNISADPVPLTDGDYLEIYRRSL